MGELTPVVRFVLAFARWTMWTVGVYLLISVINWLKHGTGGKPEELTAARGQFLALGMLVAFLLASYGLL